MLRKIFGFGRKGPDDEEKVEAGAVEAAESPETESGAGTGGGGESETEDGAGESGEVAKS